MEKHNQLPLQQVSFTDGSVLLCSLAELRIAVLRVLVNLQNRTSRFALI